MVGLQDSADEARIDTFMCVHDRDVDYLFETSLRSLLTNFVPRGTVTLVTNDVSRLASTLEGWGLAHQVRLTGDADWLSRAELTLPGWFKQQIIKLRSYEFCESANFCNLGADTVLLRPLATDDIIRAGQPITYYTPLGLADVVQGVPVLQWRYERARVRNVARILRVRPTRALRYVDFINDVFCFNGDDLRSLNAHLVSLYGREPFHALLKDLTTSTSDQKRFGEWTLYSTYVLDTLRRDVAVRSTRGLLYQVHSQRLLDGFDFDTTAVHFVGKEFDVDYIRRRIGGLPD